MIIKNFRYTRESLDLKQKDLVSLFNVTNSTISGWEIGKDTMPLKHLIKYANKYNFSLDYLFGISERNEQYYPLEVNLELIGKNLRIIRKQHKKTQQDIADIINTTSSGYAHYENARNLIPTTFLFNLSLIYEDFSFDKILGRKIKTKTGTKTH